MSQRVPAEPATTGQFVTVISVIATLGMTGWFVFPSPLDWVSFIGMIGGAFIALWIRVIVNYRFEEWKAD
jgi:hypothetical protein